MCSFSVFTSDVTMISYFIFRVSNQSTSNSTNISQFKSFILFCTHNQVFIKILSQNFSVIIILNKNRSNEFVNSILLSVQHNLFAIFIINTNNLISKATKNMILIFLCVRNIIITNITINIF